MITRWPTKAYEARHSSWPYHASDFARLDSTSDSSFYSSPRFVTHIDDAAVATLREYYKTVLPRKGRILDMCSSWISHYPLEVEDAALKGDLKVTLLGMNRSELDANNVGNHGRLVVDLNREPDVAAILCREGLAGDSDQERLDACTNVVSIDYLTRPVEVLRSLRHVTKEGGKVHLVISNRCFQTKAISRWLDVDKEERLMMAGDFLHFAGWKQIEIVELRSGYEQTTDDQEAQISSKAEARIAQLRLRSQDPLWVVTAMKDGDGSTKNPASDDNA